MTDTERDQADPGRPDAASGRIPGQRAGDELDRLLEGYHGAPIRRTPPPPATGRHAGAFDTAPADLPGAWPVGQRAARPAARPVVRPVVAPPSSGPGSRSLLWTVLLMVVLVTLCVAYLAR